MRLVALIRRHPWRSVGVLGALLGLGWLTANWVGKSAVGRPDPVGPTVYSKSAIGLKAFYELLDQQDVPVSVSDEGAARHLDPESVLVIAEPRQDGPTLGEVAAMIAAGKVLLVLPKRIGDPARDNPGWLKNDTLLPTFRAEYVLRLVDTEGKVVRVHNLELQTKDGEKLLIPTAQLLHSSKIHPLLATAEGVLVGELKENGRRIVVLADPDLVSNFGILAGDNGAIATRLVRNLLGDSDGTVVFDEFVHGYTARPFDFLSILFQFPFYLVSLQALCGVGLLLWAASGRFGKPAEVAAEEIAAGKGSLIATGARLMDRPGRGFDLTNRYWDAVVRDVGRRMNAPKALDQTGLLDWLITVSRVGARPGLPKLRSDKTAVAAARDIYEWRRGALDESRRSARFSRGD